MMRAFRYLAVVTFAASMPAHSQSVSVDASTAIDDFENKQDYIAPDDESLLYLQTKIKVLEEQMAAANNQILTLTTALKTQQNNLDQLYDALIDAGLIRLEEADK